MLRVGRLCPRLPLQDLQHNHRAGAGADFRCSLAGCFSLSHYLPLSPLYHSKHHHTYPTCCPTSFEFLDSRDNVSASLSPTPLAVLGRGRIKWVTKGQVSGRRGRVWRLQGEVGERQGWEGTVQDSPLSLLSATKR